MKKPTCQDNLLVCVACAALILLALASGTAHAALPPQHLRDSIALQHKLGRHVPLAYHGLLGTHNTYNRDDTTSLSIEDPHNQKYTTLQLLNDFGTRIVELDPHYLESTNFAASTEADRAVACHVSRDGAQAIYDVCSGKVPVGSITFNWPLCGFVGIKNYGNDTGCPAGAPKMSVELAELRTWLDEHTDEVLVVYLDDLMDGEDALMDSLVVAAFGSLIYTPPASMTGFSWPSVQDLVDQNKRVVLFSNRADPSPHMFPEALRNRIPVSDFDSGAMCDWSVPHQLPPPFTFVQGDTTRYVYQNNVLFDSTDDGANLLTTERAAQVVRCGLQASVDGMDADMLESLVWAWTVGKPSNSSTSLCAAATKPDNWTFSDFSCSESRHFFACRNDTNALHWRVSEANGTWSSSAGKCPAGFSFAVPHAPLEAAAFRGAAQGSGVAAPVWVNYAARFDESTSKQCWKDGLAPIADEVCVEGVFVLPEDDGDGDDTGGDDDDDSSSFFDDLMDDPGSIVAIVVIIAIVAVVGAIVVRCCSKKKKSSDDNSGVHHVEMGSSFYGNT